MICLGAYSFSLGTAAYQEFSRSTRYRWARQPRTNTNDALQNTGQGEDSISLRGVVFPFWKGGLHRVDLLRVQATLAIPLPLIDGRGNIYGLWVREEIRETQSVFAAAGAPKRQEFDISLTRYDGGLRALPTLLRTGIPSM